MSLPIKTDSIEVVSGGAADPKIVSGTADPTLGFASPEGSIYLRYGAGTGKAYVKSGAGVTNWGEVDSGGGGAAIGAAVSGGTIGSALFVGVGPALAQDNANFFFDFTNKRLGVGTNAPGTILDITGAGNTSGIALRGGSATTVSAVSTARLRFNEGTNKLQVSENGGAYADIGGGNMAIGAAITSATAGSVLFAGAAGILAQDNASLFWDDTNNRLGIGTAAPVWPLHIVQSNAAGICGRMRGAAATSYSAIEHYDQSDAFQAMIGYGNSNVALTHFRSKTFIQSSNVDVVFGSASQNMIEFGVGNGSLAAYLDMNNGQSSAVLSAAARVRIRYNHSTIKFQVSMNAGAFQDFVTTSGGAAFTQGSVIFQGTAGNLQQDNANFFWDDTNNRLGIGTAAPGVPLDVRGRVEIQKAVGTTFASVDGLGAGLAVLDTTAQATGVGGAINFYGKYNGAGNYAGGGAIKAMKANGTDGNYDFDLVLGSRVNGSTEHVENMRLPAGGGIQILGSAVGVSAANTGRLRYTTTGQKFQVSLNGAAYVDVATGSGMALGGTITGGATPGAILYVGGGPTLAEDPTRLFWSGGLSRLGVGTGSPLRTLHVEHTAFSSLVYLRNAQGGSFTAVDFMDDVGGLGFQIGHDSGLNINYVHSDSYDFLIRNGTRTNVILGSVADAAYVALAHGGTAAVSAASTGRLRYTTSGQKFQISTNGGAYVDLGTLSVERLSVDGAASPTINVAFVSGAGTDLTLADGTVDGFIKNFIITGGTGTITPTNLADGNVLTWSAVPANVSFIWDATGATWHVYGNPYNMVTT
jgi:hypothetical protein